METNEQKKRRLYGKQDLPLYLGELHKILKKEITASMLLSIIETDKIREQNQAKQLRYSSKILFTDKDKLENILLEDLDEVNNKYYVFTSYSKDCGTILINLLREFNFDFSFKDVPSGIITLTREDLLKEIVLDFYEENKIQYLDIEILHK
ncbi:hypothetical protein [Flectobacillus major]|uniref:hypothetical protein n=1 Tax=Flectobacillus major TaxID=103 RepID=UPI000409CAA6|nr:hypothetical protein [Flectobacillus major]